MGLPIYSICEWQGVSQRGQWCVWVVFDQWGDIRRIAETLESAIGWVWDHLYISPTRSN